MKPISRRNFLRSSAALGGTVIGASIIPKFAMADLPDDSEEIISITSAEPMENLYRVMEPYFGPIADVVKSGETVGLLTNSPWVHPGFYTHPDIVLCMMKLCKEAGAGKIVCYKPVRDDYWQESQYYEQMKPILEEVIYGDERVTVEIPDGKLLKSAEVFKIFMETDRFINIPVAKHHNGTIYSGVLKGLMGVSSRDTNRYMHSPDGEYTYAKEEYLAGCIADLNLIRKPNLCIVDAGLCAISNGPRGPGDTTSPGRILIGSDPLAMDVYASSLLGMDPGDILTFQKAKEHALGNSELETIKVLEL